MIANTLRRLADAIAPPPPATHIPVAIADGLGHALADVIAERERQAAQWGGPDGDDCNDLATWRGLILRQVDKLTTGDDVAAADYRARLVKLAALAVAAIESGDRLTGAAPLRPAGPPAPAFAPAPAPAPVPAVPALADALAAPGAVDTMARTLWGEARGEGPAGMAAVAWVIRNRVASRVRWWGRGVVGVCRHPFQFSCWNPGDPNLIRLRDVTVSDPHFTAAVRIARDVLAGRVPDPTGGADHYHAATVAPDWARGREPTARIGGHLFYKLH